MPPSETFQPQEVKDVSWVGEWTPAGAGSDTAEFIKHIVSLTRTGLPLPSGMKALAEELPSKRVRAALIATSERLEKGASLDEAVTAEPNKIPPQLRGILVAGSVSGRLSEVLAQYVRYASLGATLRRKLRFALAYPLFLGMFLFSIYIFICFAIVQNFEFVMRDFGLEQPLLTRALVWTARVTREHGLEIIGVVLGAAAALYVLLWLTCNSVYRRRMLISLPLYGKIVQFSTLAEFSHMAGLLVESEMPLPDALVLSADGVNDAELKHAFENVRRSVAYGRTLGDSLAYWPRCPAGLVDVLRGAEGRGDLAEAFHLAGDMFETRTRMLVSYASALCAVVTVFLVLSGVGFVFTALYMPMINLISRLSG